VRTKTPEFFPFVSGSSFRKTAPSPADHIPYRRDLRAHSRRLGTPPFANTGEHSAAANAPSSVNSAAAVDPPKMPLVFPETPVSTAPSCRFCRGGAPRGQLVRYHRASCPSLSALDDAAIDKTYPPGTKALVALSLRK